MQIYANNYLNWKRKDGTLRMAMFTGLMICQAGCLEQGPQNGEWRALHFEKRLVMAGDTGEFKDNQM